MRIGMLRRIPVATIALACMSIVMVLAYRALLGSDPEPVKNDQVQYLALARGLLDRGEFTRAVHGEPFVPESLRYPGYPVFVALVCRTVGCDHVADTQAVLLAIMVVLVVRFARPLLGARGALVSGALVALNPAFGYFAALRLSDTLAALLLVTASATMVTLVERPSLVRASACGLLLGALAMTRPFFLPLPLLLVLLAFFARDRWRSLAVPALVLLAAFGFATLPMVAYSISNFGRPLTGGSGVQLWQGYFQGLSRDNLDAFEREQVDLGVESIDREASLTDRPAQAYAFAALDEELRRRAIDLIRHDPFGWIRRGVIRSIELWGGDPPARDGGATLSATARGIWYAGNLAFLGIGVIGAARLIRRPLPPAVVPLAIVMFVWILSFPFLAEGRYSLPAKPFLAIGVVAALSRRQ